MADEKSQHTLRGIQSGWLSTLLFIFPLRITGWVPQSALIRNSLRGHGPGVRPHITLDDLPKLGEALFIRSFDFYGITRGMSMD